MKGGEQTMPFGKKMQITGISFLYFIISCTSVFCAEYVIPCGETVGIKLYTEGLLVVGTTDVTDISGKTSNPASKSEVKKGDVILTANGTELNKTETLSQIAENCNGSIELNVKRKNEIKNITFYPAMTENGYKLGLWVRDSTAGIGTITYISSDKTSYAALGHAITDVDTNTILSLKSGNILNCSLSCVIKSEKNHIGELSCNFDGENIGNISLNNKNGIYGLLNNPYSGNMKEMRVAKPNEIQKGEAFILCNADGNGVKKYSAQIKSISENNLDDKCLVIEITDPELIELTGGIVQGMSGSPIIQNDLFVGAVTHVFVNNPLKGFGVFGESMLNNTKNL